MKTTFLLGLLVALQAIGAAQAPRMTVRQDDGSVKELRIEEARIGVRFAGDVAETTLELNFRNSGPRAVEGEFALGLPSELHRPGRHVMREMLRGVIPESVRNNRDKSDPARSRSYLIGLTETVRTAGLGLRVLPDRMRLLDVPRFAEQLDGEGPLAQPGKLLAATQFVHDPKGVPLRDLMATAP